MLDTSRSLFDKHCQGELPRQRFVLVELPIAVFRSGQTRPKRGYHTRADSRAVVSLGRYGRCVRTRITTGREENHGPDLLEAAREASRFRHGRHNHPSPSSLDLMDDRTIRGGQREDSEQTKTSRL